MCRWMGSHFHAWIDYNGEREDKGAKRMNPPYAPYTHRNPSKDIFRSSLRPVVRKRFGVIANHMSLILPMLKGGQRPLQCFATFANQLIRWQRNQVKNRLRTLEPLENKSHVYVLWTNATAGN